MRFWILIFIVFTADFSLNAQKVKTFEDKFGIQGEIRSQEEFLQMELPEKGKIDIRWREIDFTGIKTYRVKGQTQNRLPVGKWIWEEAHWNYTLKVGNDIRPEFDSKGKRKKWEGSFLNGKPDGKWNFVSDSISSNSKTNKTLVKIDLSYKNGIPTGIVTFENHENQSIPTLRGTLDKDGIASGTWVYQYKKDGKNLKEERIYKGGLLTKVQFTQGNERTEEELFHNIQFLKNPDNSEKKIGEMLFEKEEFSSLASEDFFIGMNNHFLKGWKLDVFSYEVIFELPKFRRLKYPLTTEEENDIKESKNLIRKQRNLIENLLTDNIYIHRSRSVEIDTTVSYLQLNLSRINYIDSLLSRIENPLFLYKNRHEQTGKSWIKGLNDLRSAKGEAYDSAIIYIPEITVSESVNVFEKLKQELTRSENVLPKYSLVVENILTRLKREGELKTLEDKLVERFMQLQTFYSESEGIRKEINEKWIKKVQNGLQQYSQTEDYEKALQLGNHLTEQLNALSKWKDKADDFDNMSKSLKSHYTYMAYNPYTGANDIEIVRKRRFLNNVLEDMLPYIRKELSQEQDFDKWSALWERQFVVYDFLVDFVSREDSQANRLERRIRTEKKPERMVKNILGQVE